MRSLCFVRERHSLEGIAPDPADQRGHPEAVQRLLLVVADELWDWQRALETERNEAKDVYKDRRAAEDEEEDGEA